MKSKLNITVRKDMKILNLKTISALVKSKTMYDLLGLDKTEVYGFYLHSPESLSDNNFRFYFEVVTLLDVFEYELDIHIASNFEVSLSLLDAVLFGGSLKSLTDFSEDSIKNLELKIKNYDKFILYTEHKLSSNTLYDFYTKQISTISSDTSKEPIDCRKTIVNLINSYENKWYKLNCRNKQVLLREREIYVRFLKNIQIFDSTNKLRTVKINLEENCWGKSINCKIYETQTYFHVLTSRYYIEYEKSTGKVYFASFKELSIKEIFSLMCKRGFIFNDIETYQKFCTIFDLRRKIT